MNKKTKKRIKRIYYTAKKIFDFPKEIKFYFRKKNAIFNPVFIIGCGRSGTTILGRTLSKQPSICYLNERRDLWHSAYPELDIWSGNQNAKLVAGKSDYDAGKTKKLRKIFFREQVAANATILLEKLPINNFRLEFLNACFPEARYIYLYRNGLEVAQSISKRVPHGWFGNRDSKLDLLLDFAKHRGFSITKNDLSSDLYKGIFEWRLSIEQSDKFFRELDQKKFISLSYSDLIENDHGSIAKIFDFLDLQYDDLFLDKICNSIERKNSAIAKIDDEFILSIGGKLMAATISNNYSPLK